MTQFSREQCERAPILEQNHSGVTLSFLVLVSSIEEGLCLDCGQDRVHEAALRNAVAATMPSIIQAYSPYGRIRLVVPRNDHVWSVDLEKSIKNKLGVAYENTSKFEVVTT